MSYRFLTIHIVGALLLLFIASSAQADTSWILPPGQSGDWSEPSNWDNGEPSSTVYVNTYITNGGTATITLPGETSRSLYLGGADLSTVRMTDGTFVPRYMYVGYNGNGLFDQSGGSVSGFNYLYLGYNAGDNGTYLLSGSAYLQKDHEYVGVDGTGTFTQSGGTNTCHLYVGANGTYTLSGSGLLRGFYQSITGTFNQTGGTNSVGVGSSKSAGLRLPAGGNYNLDAGLLAAHGIWIYSGGTLRQSGGTLQLESGFSVGYATLACSGVFDGNGGSGVITAGINSLLDFSEGTIINADSMSLSTGENSFVMLPTGFDPVTGFGSYNNPGITHVKGTTLAVAAGQSCDVKPYSRRLEINDPVECQGAISITAWYGNHYEPGFNINNGLTISGAGSIDGALNVIINDPNSSMSGGSLNAYYQYVGKSGTGTFTQNDGTNNLAQKLFVGYDAGDTGTYVLSDSGSLTVSDESYPTEYIGYSGTGTFIQTGGTNTIMQSPSGYYGYATLALGSQASGHGTYELSNTGQLSASYETIGEYGTGVFIQSGGVNSVYWLKLAGGAKASGTYNLNGGVLKVERLSKGSGAASFNFGGGTLQASASFSARLPITLTGIDGNANVDTDGYEVTFSDALSGEGGLHKLGLGTLTLDGVNTYTGNTTVSDGLLTLSSSGSLLLDISSGGDSTSILGEGSIDLDGTLAFDLTDVLGPGEWDVLAVDTLTETFGDNFNVEFVFDSDTFTAVETSPGVWTSDIAPLGSAIFTESTGMLTVVPEPGTLSLLAVGLLCLLGTVGGRIGMRSA